MGTHRLLSRALHVHPLCICIGTVCVNPGQGGLLAQIVYLQLWFYSLAFIFSYRRTCDSGHDLQTRNDISLSRKEV